LANYAASEETFERMQDLHITLVLHYCEFRQNLVACLHFGLRVDAYKETPFPIDEADNPLRFQLSLGRD
jgi:hypothetical protein